MNSHVPISFETQYPAPCEAKSQYSPLNTTSAGSADSVITGSKEPSLRCLRRWIMYSRSIGLHTVRGRGFSFASFSEARPSSSALASTMRALRTSTDTPHGTPCFGRSL